MTSLTFRVLVENKDIAFSADAGQTILAAAEAAGVDLPSSCRNGTCRTCLCRMTHGQVRYQIEWPGLSAEEKLAGDILPCVAIPVGDVRLQASARRRPR
jgi:ferredoxin